MRRLVSGLAALIAAMTGGRALAQDINGVPNADVRAGYQAISYRVGYSLFDAAPSAFAQQISYQQNFGERWSLSGAANFGKRGDEPLEFKAFQAIAEWQFAEDEEAGADGALLLIARQPDNGNGPGRVVLAAAGKWIVRDIWEIRSVFGANVEYGDNAEDGVGLGGRIEATRRIGAIGRLGAQTAHSFNTTAHFGSFSDQNHQAGLVAKTLIGPLSITATSLFGLSRAAPDAEFRLFLTYEL